MPKFPFGVVGISSMTSPALMPLIRSKSRAIVWRRNVLMVMAIRSGHSHLGPVGVMMNKELLMVDNEIPAQLFVEVDLPVRRGGQVSLGDVVDLEFVKAKQLRNGEPV